MDTNRTHRTLMNLDDETKRLVAKYAIDAYSYSSLHDMKELIEDPEELHLVEKHEAIIDHVIAHLVDYVVASFDLVEHTPTPSERADWVGVSSVVLGDLGEYFAESDTGTNVMTHDERARDFYAYMSIITVPPDTK